MAARISASVLSVAAPRSAENYHPAPTGPRRGTNSRSAHKAGDREAPRPDRRDRCSRQTAGRAPHGGKQTDRGIDHDHAVQLEFPFARVDRLDDGGVRPPKLYPSTSMSVIRTLRGRWATISCMAAYKSWHLHQVSATPVLDVDTMKPGKVAMASSARGSPRHTVPRAAPKSSWCCHRCRCLK